MEKETPNCEVCDLRPYVHTVTDTTNNGTGEEVTLVCEECNQKYNWTPTYLKPFDVDNEDEEEYIQQMADRLGGGSY